MSLIDDALEDDLDADMSALEKELLRAKTTSENRRKELERLRRREAKLLVDNSNLEAVLEGLQSISEYEHNVPKWIAPKKKPSKHAVTPFLMLSDLHLDEVVEKSEVYGWNEYNREIATARLERTVNKTIELTSSYISGFTYDGMVLLLGGDILNGNAHEEFISTNEGTIMQAIVYWVPQLAAAIAHFADEYGKLYIPCVRGNHDRYSLKKPAKKQAEESFTWVVYHWLADHFKGDSRITFDIATSPDLQFTVYDKNYLLTHGDNGLGGGGSAGMAGVYPSICRGLAKKHARNASLGAPFDYGVLGHYHTYLTSNNVIMNGSMKGYDEYASNFNMGFEKPRQAFWIQAPNRGITCHMPVFCD